MASQGYPSWHQPIQLLSITTIRHQRQPWLAITKHLTFVHHRCIVTQFVEHQKGWRKWLGSTKTGGDWGVGASSLRWEPPNQPTNESFDLFALSFTETTEVEGPSSSSSWSSPSPSPSITIHHQPSLTLISHYTPKYLCWFTHYQPIINHVYGFTTNISTSSDDY